MTVSENRGAVIVGAGAAGLATLRKFLAAGIDAIALEGGSQPGGIWVYENDNGLSPAYRTLHINTDRRRTAYEGFAFPDDIQPYPSHEEMAEYFRGYVERFSLAERIRFRTWVERIRPAAGGRTGWEIVTRDGRHYVTEHVVIATGHLSEPREFDSPLLDDFDGDYLHAHHYRSPDDFVGKGVAIIGIGNSAADIATDICSVARRTIVVARSGVLVRPKFAFGRPYPDVMMALQKWWIPSRLRGAVNRFLCFALHGRMEDLGFVPLTERVHPTSSATLVNQILYERIRIAHGIDAIDGRQVRFSDGTTEHIDVIVGATGYRITLPFLEPLVSAPDNRLDLYKRILHPDLPGLYFVGFANSIDLPLNFMFERQAEWMVPFVLGNARPPASTAMHADIDARWEAMRSVYRHTPRHTMDVEMLPYSRELRTSLSAAISTAPFGGTREGRRIRRRLHRRRLGPLY